MSTNHEPVDSAILDRLERCSPSAVADTKHESVETLASAIEPVHPDCTFAGTVRTVVLDPSALWAPVQTLDTALEDEVVVVDTDDSVEEAVWGELLSTYAQSAGVRGMVTNGAVRDIDGIAALGFPVFARAATPRGPSGRDEAERNVQVTVGGASISPGDVLVGDESGVVVIGRDAVEEVTSAAETVAQKERDVARLIHDGQSLEQAFENGGMG
ncbi:RraA family protein [Haloferax sp. DFSO52]|uniref:RraA family protein n=1 Tax=Haloferax sp. DFSO52 TaxID=3388505 RepID=UPI003A8400C7